MIVRNGVGVLTYKQGVGVKQALSAGNETLARGIYDATTLSAVDAQLTPSNIKKDVNIFGFTGTYEPSLAEDVEGDDVKTTYTTTTDTLRRGTLGSIVPDAEGSLVSKVLTFDAASLAFAAAFACMGTISYAGHHLRLYMGGVLMQTSAALPVGGSKNFVLRDFKVLAGSSTCELKVWNDSGQSGSYTRFPGLSSTSEFPAAIAVGSVKLA